MQDFNHKNPTEIIFGKGNETKIGSFLVRDSIKKVLLVYGTQSIKKNGLYTKVTSSLTNAGIAFVEYSGIQSNPLVLHVDEAAELARKENVEAILAVGGGSVMDSGKAIAATALISGSVWSFYTGEKITRALPVYIIATLSATASEMNCGFVLTNSTTKQKLGNGSNCLFPKLSILNPELTFTVPKNYTIYGSVDTIAHAIENYLTTTNESPLMSRLTEGIIKTVIEMTPIVLEDPNNYDARAELMWTATIALNGTVDKGYKDSSFPNHMIEHGLSAITDIPHGAGLSIIIPAWMKWYKNKNEKRFLLFAKEVFNVNTADEGIQKLEAWFKLIGSPTRLSTININVDEILDSVSSRAHNQASYWGLDKFYTLDVIKEILLLAK